MGGAEQEGRVRREHIVFRRQFGGRVPRVHGEFTECCFSIYTPSRGHGGEGRSVWIREGLLMGVRREIHFIRFLHSQLYLEGGLGMEAVVRANSFSTKAEVSVQKGPFQCWCLNRSLPS